MSATSQHLTYATFVRPDQNGQITARPAAGQVICTFLDQFGTMAYIQFYDGLDLRTANLIQFRYRLPADYQTKDEKAKKQHMLEVAKQVNNPIYLQSSVEPSGENFSLIKGVADTEATPYQKQVLYTTDSAARVVYLRFYDQESRLIQLNYRPKANLNTRDPRNKEVLETELSQVANMLYHGGMFAPREAVRAQPAQVRPMAAAYPPVQYQPMSSVYSEEGERRAARQQFVPAAQYGQMPSPVPPQYPHSPQALAMQQHQQPAFQQPAYPYSAALVMPSAPPQPLYPALFPSNPPALSSDYHASQPIGFFAQEYPQQHSGYAEPPPAQSPYPYGQQSGLQFFSPATSYELVYGYGETENFGLSCSRNDAIEKLQQYINDRIAQGENFLTRRLGNYTMAEKIEGAKKLISLIWFYSQHNGSLEGYDFKNPVGDIIGPLMIREAEALKDGDLFKIVQSILPEGHAIWNEIGSRAEPTRSSSPQFR